jgi:ATP-dependent Clp protease ATP-binding subunit ClpA
MLTKNLEITLRNAMLLANMYKHEYATSEHLLLALLNDDDTKSFFQKNNIDASAAISDLQNYLKHNLSDLVSSDYASPKRSAEFQRILQKAESYADAVGESEVTALHLIAEFYLAPKSYATACLKALPTSRNDIIRHIDKHLLNSLKEPELIIDTTTSSFNEYSTQDSSNDKKQDSILENFCTNLNLKAESGAIDRLIGRDAEIQRTIEVLARRKKNNVILVGEPGVGKTAIAEGLALRFIKQDVPKILQNSVIYSLDIGSLVAGTKFRGDFEERIKQMLNELKANPDSILFIDEIHTIMGAGSTTSGSLDANNLLKPAFARGEIRCIGATTFKEYHAHFEKDAALARRFQKIIIEEPSEETSINILKGLKEYYEKHHNVKYTDDAITGAVLLSEKYIKSRKLPDKAIDLIDEAGARQKLLGTSDEVALKDIEELVAIIANIPQISISTDDTAELKLLAQNLKGQIFGQDEAIEALCDNIKLSRAGLKNANHPIGCYLFAGASGVGKTELAKQLAKFCNMELIKLDMSEYLERNSISSLIGSPPGYAASEAGGILTESVDRAGYSVVLFDEIEKAHPEIFNLLLQIMDEGKLTDSTGKIVDFTHTIIILTTNLGASGQTKEPIGFFNDKKQINNTKNHSSLEAIEKGFNAELRNRLDDIIIFNPLNPKIISMIIEKNLKEFVTSLAQKKIEILIDPSVNKYLMRNANIEVKGVRGLEKLIEHDLKQSIAEEILFGKLSSGGKILVAAKSDKLHFKFLGNKTEKLTVA